MSKAVTFAVDPAFSRAARRMLGEDGIAEFKSYLSRNPLVGDVIAGTGGIRKVRWAAGGKGKRGGARVIYFFISEDALIYLLDIYAKSVKSNLSKAEMNEFKKLTAVIKRSHRRK